MRSRHAAIAFAILAAAAAGTIARAASLDGMAVQVLNRSEPVLCAEKDNVTVAFASDTVRRFTIEAHHPAYIDTLQRDRFAADWTACDIGPPPANAAPPRKVTLYEDVDLWVTGYTFGDFWRPATVPLRIGERVATGLHLVQVWVRANERAEEVLVVYPPDGYWRARPLPPKHLGWSAYGSSFLGGPVSDEGRPLVKLRALAFDPKSRTFALTFEDGNAASLRIAALDDAHQRIEVVFDRPVAGQTFAALRSMYVTEFNNDAARIALRAPGAPGWREEPLMRFADGPATDVWIGRLVPSRHNTSAPDMVFRAFAAAP